MKFTAQQTKICWAFLLRKNKYRGIPNISRGYWIKLRSWGEVNK